VWRTTTIIQVARAIMGCLLAGAYIEVSLPENLPQSDNMKESRGIVREDTGQ